MSQNAPITIPHDLQQERTDALSRLNADLKRFIATASFDDLERAHRQMQYYRKCCIDILDYRAAVVNARVGEGERAA